MSSAWGQSFGSAWGNAFGNLGIIVVPPDDEIVRRAPGIIPRLRHPARAGVRLQIGCTVSSSAGLQIGGRATVKAKTGVAADAALRIGAALAAEARTEIRVSADVVDVVLEMLLLTD